MRRVWNGGVSTTLRRASGHRGLSYFKSGLEAQVWRHPNGTGYVTLLKDWGRWRSQQCVLPLSEALRTARCFIDSGEMAS